MFKANLKTRNDSLLKENCRLQLEVFRLSRKLCSLLKENKKLKRKGGIP